MGKTVVIEVVEVIVVDVVVVVDVEVVVVVVVVVISILPKKHAGPIEKLISDFFRMPKKLAQ